MAFLILFFISMGYAAYVENFHGSNNIHLTHNCKSHSHDPWCLPNDYDLNIDPFHFKDISPFPLPWNYSYEFLIHEVAGVSDKRQQISFLMYFRVQWYEPRIQINLSSTEWLNANGGVKEYLFIPFTTSVWLPDLEIYNLRNFGSKKIITESHNLRINPNKMVMISTYADVSVTCQMDFSRFPFDHQNCDFLITSFSKTNDTVKCSAKTEIEDELRNFDEPTDYPQRSLQYNITWMSKSLKRTVTFSFGTWEYCGFSLRLDRIRTKYYAEAYMPSCIFVVLSWISFLIKPDALPGRVTLLLNIFLVLIILMGNAKESSPDLHRINAIDIYIVACSIHVFFAILEYAILLLLMKCFDLDWKNCSKLNKRGHKNTNLKLTSVKEAGGANKSATDDKDMEHIDTDNASTMVTNRYILLIFCHLDWISLILFPTSFTIFNIYYWNNYK